MPVASSIPDEVRGTALSRETVASIPNLFLINPANRAFVDGKKNIIGQYRALVVWIVIACAMLVAGSAYAISNISAYNNLIASGQTTQARIKSGIQSNGSCTLSYEFDVTDSAGSTRTYFGNGPAEMSFCTDASFDNPLLSETVTYLPDNPSVSTLESQSLKARNIALVFALIIIFALIGVGGPLFMLYRNRQFTRQGMLLQGEIIGVQFVNRQGVSQVDYNYQFFAPDSQIIYGVGTRTVSMFARPVVVPKGTPVALLFVNRQSFKIL